MKIVCISDTHTKHYEIPTEYLENKDGSIETIIHAGDVTSRGYKSEVIGFLDWFNELPIKNKIFIAGNHDFFFEKAPAEEVAELMAKYPNITYLNDSGVEIDGIKIWGSPVQPWFYNWAFNRMGFAIMSHWNMIPVDTDILITHGPVRGYLDMTLEGDLTGCPYLLETITKMSNLKLHVCGHIHEAYGRADFVDGAVFLNASVLNRNYTMTNKPIEIEINK